jgi:hypothetical protein
MSATAAHGRTGLDRLRTYAGERRRPADERCEFCGVVIDHTHGHLVNVTSRSLLCVCRPCYLLFTHEGAGGGRFIAVPDRCEALSSPLAGEAWEALQIPIGLAFFFRNSGTGRVTAFYPSPAGTTESELALTAWEDLVRAHPQLDSMTPDVEALLVRRSGPHGSMGVSEELTAFIVPIDICYELVGRIRRSWRGFQGGEEVRREIDDFFAGIAARAASGGAAGDGDRVGNRARANSATG